MPLEVLVLAVAHAAVDVDRRAGLDVDDRQVRHAEAEPVLVAQVLATADTSRYRGSARPRPPGSRPHCAGVVVLCAGTSTATGLTYGITEGSVPGVSASRMSPRKSSARST